MTVSEKPGGRFFRRHSNDFTMPSISLPTLCSSYISTTTRSIGEIVGLIASALAYGRVAQVLKSVGLVLDKMGPSPRCFLEETEESGLMERFSGFRHRFTTGRELAELLTGIRRVIRRHGSLQACFLAGFRPGADTVGPALAAFVRELGEPWRGSTTVSFRIRVRTVHVSGSTCT